MTKESEMGDIAVEVIEKRIEYLQGRYATTLRNQTKSSPDALTLCGRLSEASDILTRVKQALSEERVKPLPVGADVSGLVKAIDYFKEELRKAFTGIPEDSVSAVADAVVNPDNVHVDDHTPAIYAALVEAIDCIKDLREHMRFVSGCEYDRSKVLKDPEARFEHALELIRNCRNLVKDFVEDGEGPVGGYPDYQTFRSSGEWEKPSKVKETVVTGRGGRGSGGGGGSPNTESLLVTIHNHTELDVEIKQDPETGKVSINTVGSSSEVAGSDDAQHAQTLYESIVEDWIECVALTQPRRNDQTTTARLHHLRERIKRNLDVMLDTIKENVSEDPKPQEVKNKPWAHPSIIFVDITEGAEGLLYATSPQIPGFLVAKRTMEELQQALPQAIAELYAATIQIKIRSK